MTWNYRVIHHNSESVGEWYSIHEVYYDDNGEPNGVTSDAIEPVGETKEELRQDLEFMMEALKQPVLEYDDFPAAGELDAHSSDKGA